MKKGTPFGRAVRMLRVDRGETLADLADAVGVTAAFLSAIETGRKNVPEGLVTKLGRHYGLGRNQVEDLRALAAKSRSEITIGIDGKNEETRDLVAVFARRFDTLTPSARDQIKKLLTKGER